ncbi:hypothetical protein [Cryobacterium cryoconiti]|uniref:Uncharacterized protein n=1 Tax=Cryobacterium cryoconiti TaxID=1259239 RepID=A0A4Y8JWA5_9MICO|nr:hypothetical protein [Cryobacterium cryoconiti]TFD31468.1 hypothetical protein E3T49_06205 [Cryobacterium cryoconiti]
MTLGNNPQPLTRRQARELANGHDHAATDSAVPPAPLAPAADLLPAGSTPAASVSAFAPRPVDVPPSDATSLEHTLTRRELRALHAAQTVETDEYVPRQDAPAETSAVAGSAPAPAAYTPPAFDPAPSVHPFAIDALHVPAAPAKAAPPVEFMIEATPRTRVKARPGVLHPPVGHWSLARDEVDEHRPGVTQLEPFDQIVARGISAGGIPTTTNALILPSIPHQGSTSGPLSSTGEIMVTGSIDLPRSLGSTGALPHLFDSSDMDQMLEQLDEGGHHSDVAPVSASRAVSTHASTRGVMAPPVKRGVTVPAVLTVTAGVLAFGVAALFVAGYVLNIF